MTRVAASIAPVTIGVEIGDMVIYVLDRELAHNAINAVLAPPLWQNGVEQSTVVARPGRRRCTRDRPTG